METLRSWVVKQKHDNYEALKVWDQRRAALLTIHAKSLQQLRETLQLRLQQSLEFMQSVRQFLAEHCRQLVSDCNNLRNFIRAAFRRAHTRSSQATFKSRRSKSKLRRC